MKVTASELKSQLGRYLVVSETEAVIIEKSGRLKSVLISYANFQEYQELKRKNNNYSKPNLIDLLIDKPKKIKNFEPLSREKTHRR